ncbi:PQQ-binding-like beta-propeller repeat protein [Rhodococcoides kyotonense]|uniref:PQQ-binding-like beta-propeller repeat protein n=1 Tax=Rhodococcoides kyotonense TaxID=398843 RepID=UPI00113275A0|nr:PQQ-binding-like beta-propeller repeat protein [Rhodococcus kyotonensis]
MRIGHRVAGLVVGVVLFATGCATQSPDEPVVDARFGTGDFAVAPVPAWTVDAAALGTVTHSVPFSLPQVPNADAPMLLGLTDGDYSQNPRGLRVLALDPSSGERSWLRDVGPVRQCAEQIDDTILACYGDHRVVYVDVTDGRIVGDIATDFYVYHVRAAGGVGYVSGRSDDMLTSTIHSGTLEDLDARWSASYPSPVPGQPASPAVFPDKGIADVYSSGARQIIDIDTGEPRFVFTGENPLPLGNDLFVTVTRAPDGALREAILDGVGQERTEVPVATVGLSPLPWANLYDSELPRFLGDGAYDAYTGVELWRNPATLENNGGINSAVLAVVGDTVVVRSSETRTFSGIDLGTGRTTWTTPWQDAYWARAGTSDGEHYVFGDYTGMHAIRASDGVMMWSIPWPEGVDPREVSVSETAGVLTVSDRFGSTVWAPSR